MSLKTKVPFTKTHISLCYETQKPNTNNKAIIRK